MYMAYTKLTCTSTYKHAAHMFSRGYSSELYADEEDKVTVPSFTNLAGMRTLLFFFALLIGNRTSKFKVHKLM